MDDVVEINSELKTTREDIQTAINNFVTRCMKESEKDGGSFFLLNERNDDGKLTLAYISNKNEVHTLDLNINTVLNEIELEDERAFRDNGGTISHVKETLIDVPRDVSHVTLDINNIKRSTPISHPVTKLEGNVEGRVAMIVDVILDHIQEENLKKNQEEYEKNQTEKEETEKAEPEI